MQLSCTRFALRSTAPNGIPLSRTHVGISAKPARVLVLGCDSHVNRTCQVVGMHQVRHLTSPCPSAQPPVRPSAHLSLLSCAPCFRRETVERHVCDSQFDRPIDRPTNRQQTHFQSEFENFCFRRAKGAEARTDRQTDHNQRRRSNGN